jgi:iron uptake system EfeUOB component EfeO/EfeM
MNVSGVNSATTAYQTSVQSSFKQRAQDFKALQTALQSGDVTTAQQAFASLQKDMQTSSKAAGATSNQSSQTSQLGADFQTLQSALQSGDLSGAQSAFATLKQDLQSTGAAHGAHHHHHHMSGNATSSTSPASSSTSSSSDVGSIISSLLDTQA